MLMSCAAGWIPHWLGCVQQCSWRGPECLYTFVPFCLLWGRVCPTVFVQTKSGGQKVV